jgi:hypothetical protein
MNVDPYKSITGTATLLSILATAVIYAICVPVFLTGSPYTILLFGLVPPLVYGVMVALYPQREKNKPANRILYWILLLAAAFVFSYLSDRVAGIINRDVPRAYARMLEEYLVENGKPQRNLIDEFRTYSFFMQNIYSNLAGLMAGALVGFVIDYRKIKKAVLITA